jgi:hypothetical protein
MLVLHQWHNITAYGEDAIIRRANLYKLSEFYYALQQVAHGLATITTIEDAIDYLEGNDKGCVKDEIQPNEISCEE